MESASASVSPASVSPVQVPCGGCLGKMSPQGRPFKCNHGMEFKNKHGVLFISVCGKQNPQGFAAACETKVQHDEKVKTQISAQSKTAWSQIDCVIDARKAEIKTLPPVQRGRAASELAKIVEELEKLKFEQIPRKEKEAIISRIKDQNLRMLAMQLVAIWEVIDQHTDELCTLNLQMEDVQGNIAGLKSNVDEHAEKLLTLTTEIAELRKQEKERRQREEQAQMKQSERDEELMKLQFASLAHSQAIKKQEAATKQPTEQTTLLVHTGNVVSFASSSSSSS